MSKTKEFTSPLPFPQPSDMTRHVPLRLGERRALLFTVDLLMVAMAVLVALRLWALADDKPFSLSYLSTQAHWFIWLSIVWLAIAFLHDFHNPLKAADLVPNLFILSRICVVILSLYLLIYFFAPRDLLPRLFVLLFAAATFALVGLWRGIYSTVLARQLFQRPLLILGAGWAGQTMARALQRHSRAGYHVVGFVDDNPAKQGQLVEGQPVLGTTERLRTLAEQTRTAEIVVAITHDLPGSLIQALMDCQERGIAITPMATLYEEITARVPVEHIGDSWYVALPLNHAGTGALYPLLKRTIDVIVATGGLLIFAVLLPFIAVLLYLDSPGPIFYTQERVGKGGRIYRVLKLRTMVPDAESGGQAVWAQANDSRITRVGRFLRRMHVDELPQFINVLRGEMSIVGPRPERPEFVAELEKQIPFYRTRHAIKPGMAGWAQVNHGYAGSVEDALVRLQYDLYYIKHQSIWLDFLILFRTLWAMLTFRGR